MCVCWRTSLFLLSFNKIPKLSGWCGITIETVSPSPVKTLLIFIPNGIRNFVYGLNQSPLAGRQVFLGHKFLFIFSAPSVCNGLVKSGQLKELANKKTRVRMSKIKLKKKHNQQKYGPKNVDEKNA